jgi:hypothetical protein
LVLHMIECCHEARGNFTPVDDQRHRLKM